MIEQTTHGVQLALSTARQWLDCIEEDEELDSVDKSLRTALRGYIAELEYRTGASQPYRDDLDRLHKLKRALRSLDPVFDELGTVTSEDELLPSEMKSLLELFTRMMLDMGGAINATERLYPQWSDFFATERQMYAEWRAGRGPLVDGPWDEAERLD